MPCRDGFCDHPAVIEAFHPKEMEFDLFPSRCSFLSHAKCTKKPFRFASSASNRTNEIHKARSVEGSPIEHTLISSPASCSFSMPLPCAFFSFYSAGPDRITSKAMFESDSLSAVLSFNVLMVADTQPSCFLLFRFLFLPAVLGVVFTNTHERPCLFFASSSSTCWFSCERVRYTISPRWADFLEQHNKLSHWAVERGGFTGCT